MIELNYAKMYEDIDTFCKKIFGKHKLAEFEKEAITALREYIIIYNRFHYNDPVMSYKDCCKVLKNAIKCVLRCQLKFSTYAPVVITITITNNRYDEQEIIKQLKYPSTSPYVAKVKSIKHIFWGIKALCFALKSTYLIKNIPHFKPRNAVLLFENLCQFYTYYIKLDFKNIKTIITECTAHYEYPAIVAKAKRCGVHIVKIDYFLTNAQTADSTRLNTQYCFPLDKVHKEFYQQFNYNKDVIYLGNGGRLNSDHLVQCLKDSITRKAFKCIVYLSSHTILASFDDYYIGLLKDFVANNVGYKLVVKVHPGDTRSFDDIICENVEVSKAIGDEYFQLACQADFVISVFSSLLYQTKLINENCYALSFYDKEKMDRLAITEGQQAYAKYLEPITSQEMLNKVLLGEHQTTTREYYIKEINPDFGHVVEEFKKYIDELP